MPRRRHQLAGLALIAALCAPPAAAAEQVETVGTRPGVIVRAIVNTDAGAGAPLAILLMGGNGIVGLDRWSGEGNPVGNFLVRARRHFAAQGLNYIVPDAPAEAPGGSPQSLLGARTGEAYAADMAAVIKHAQVKGATKIFLVGTSRGTIGAVGAAARLPPEMLAGIVLTATVTRSARRGGDSVHNAALDKIRLPVLISHHRDDPCYVTPPGDVPRLARALENAPSVTQKMYGGGGPFRGDDCGAFVAHGFPGLEAEVVADIAAWIKTVAAGGKP